MRGNVVFGLGLAMLVGVVFVLTVVRQYTATDEPKPGDSAAVGVPLLFSTTKMYPDPNGDDLGRRHFVGVHEVSSDLVAAPFWFRHPHAEPVTVTVVGRSCTSCTSARVAMVPPDRTALLARTAAVDALAHPAGGGLMTALAAAGLVADLDWKTLEFEKPYAGVVLPPCSTPGDPLALGVLQLDVKVTGIGPKQLDATVGTQLGARPAEYQRFEVAVMGAAPFALDRDSVPLGDLPEGSASRDGSFNVWSATRTFDRFPPPAAAVNIPDGFVSVERPVALTPDQLIEVGRKVAGPNQTLRVLSGYRVPVTVHRRRPAGVPGDGPAEPDVGPFDRQVSVAGPGTSTATVRYSGTVTGAVSLTDGGLIDLKDFHADAGVDRNNVELVSVRPDLVLTVDAAAGKPAFLKATLGPPRDEAGRRYWSLRVTIPPGASLGELPPDAAVVLTGTSSAGPVRVRLPVKGRGYRKG